MLFSSLSTLHSRTPTVLFTSLYSYFLAGSEYSIFRSSINFHVIAFLTNRVSYSRRLRPCGAAVIRMTLATHP